MPPPSPHRLLTVWLRHYVTERGAGKPSRGYYNRVITGTLPDISFEIGAPTGNAFFTARATTAGLSLQQFLIANITVSLVIIFIHYLVAGLVFWRLPRSWFGLTAFVILLTGSAAMEDATQVAAGLVDSLGPVVRLVLKGSYFGALVWPMFPVWLYLPRRAGRAALGALAHRHPNGRFRVIHDSRAPGHGRPTPTGAVASCLVLNERTSFVLVLVLPGLVLALVSQIYRYWRVSGRSSGSKRSGSSSV